MALDPRLSELSLRKSPTGIVLITSKLVSPLKVKHIFQSTVYTLSKYRNSAVIVFNAINFKQTANRLYY